MVPSYRTGSERANLGPESHSQSGAARTQMWPLKPRAHLRLVGAQLHLAKPVTGQQSSVSFLGVFVCVCV